MESVVESLLPKKGQKISEMSIDELRYYLATWTNYTDEMLEALKKGYAA